MIAATILPVLAPPAQAVGTPPVAYGKVAAPGALAVPYADTSNLTFPSPPPLGPSPLADSYLVYDTQVSIELVDTLSIGITVPVVTEVWTPGTVTVYRNVSTGGSNYTLEPVQVPARLNPSWSNATLTALPGGPGTVSIALVTVSTEQPLEVKVGAAVWELGYLTPATSIVSGVFTTAGIWGFAAIMAAVATISVYASAAAAMRLVRKVRSVPKTGFLWPALWVVIPIATFLLLYVPANQLLAGLSPLVIPVPFGVAVFPYWARRFSKGSTGRVQRIEFRGSKARKQEAILKLVETESGLRVAPWRWRDVLYTAAGVPLPRAVGEDEDVLGVKVQVAPEGLPVSRLFHGSEFEPEAEREYWVDTRAPVELVPNRLVWTRTTTAAGKDGAPIEKRRFSPHIEPGHLKARWVPTLPVLEVLAQIRSAESLLHDSRADQLALAEMRGTIWSRVREHTSRRVLQLEDSYRRREEPRTDEELRDLVAHNRARRDHGAARERGTQAES